MALSVAGSVKPGVIIDIEKRFYQFMIVGKQKSMLAEDEAAVDDVDIEAGDKLDIEQQAQQQRLEKQQQQQEVFEAVSNQLSATIIDEMKYRFDSLEPLLKTAPITQKQWQLLELLNSRNIDLNRLRIAISDINWLTRELINVVNSPAFRQSRSQNNDVQVTDLKLVLNFIGIEQLKFLIPYFCMRHWLPKKRVSTLWATKQLWRFANVAAIASRTLSEYHQQNQSVIYTATLTSMIGATIVIENSALVYEAIRGTWLREAKNTRNKLVHDAVLSTRFPIQFLCENVLKHGSLLNWKVLDGLDCADGQITKIMREIDQTINFSELSVSSSIVVKSLMYAMKLMLEEQCSISPKENRLLFKYFEFSEEEVLRLKAQNFRKQDIL
ncbi:MAG: HDOD domain-containing protein [Parashewanella sp.]